MRAQLLIPDHSPSPPRVLVADADEAVRALYRVELQRTGCDVLEAEDGREALTKALVRQPSLVLTELRLPLIDGFALCEILRRDRSTADVPIVVVTFESRRKEVERARRAGADVVLTKPASIETLLGEMRRLLDHSHELRRRSEASRAKVSEQVERSAALLDRSTNNRRAALSKVHERYRTTSPPAQPPDLTCPTCDQVLKYESSHIGGVSDRHPEQWDYFSCPSCGVFQYRQRTRKLHHLRDDEGRRIKD